MEVSNDELQPKTFTGIRFEPGIHSIYNENVWNKALIKRLSQYNPQFLAVDGDSPTGPSQAKGIADIFLPSEFKRDPKLVNVKDKEIFFVNGDSGFIFSPVYKTLSDSDTEGLPRSEIAEITNRLSDPETDIKPSIGRITELGAPYSLATLIYLASTSKKLGISRREFLKGALASTGLIGMSVSGLPILSTFIKMGEAFVPDDSVRRKIDAIAETIRPQFHNTDWWVNGRTALLIAKTEDAIDHLKKPRDIPAAIVMGGSHHIDSTVLLINQKLRTEVIAEYGRKFIEAANIAFEKGELAQELKEKTIKVIKDYIALTDIEKVSTSDTSKKPELIASFQSNQVVKAMNAL